MLHTHAQGLSPHFLQHQNRLSERKARAAGGQGCKCRVAAEAKAEGVGRPDYGATASARTSYCSAPSVWNLADRRFAWTERSSSERFSTLPCRRPPVRSRFRPFSSALRIRSNSSRMGIASLSANSSRRGSCSHSSARSVAVGRIVLKVVVLLAVLYHGIDDAIALFLRERRSMKK